MEVAFKQGFGFACGAQQEGISKSVIMTKMQLKEVMLNNVFLNFLFLNYSTYSDILVSDAQPSSYTFI